MTCDDVKKKIETLRESRSFLLGLEAIGWLHMAGKAKVDFLKSHGGIKIEGGYNYQKWFENDNSPFPWDDLLGWLREKSRSTNSLVDKLPESLKDFITEHAEREDDKSKVVALLQAGHAMASGIEKQSYKGVEYLGQDATNMWLSSAFGFPERNLLSDLPAVLSDEGWQKLLGNIMKLLCEGKKVAKKIKSFKSSDSQNFRDIDVADWWNWREAAVGSDGWLRRDFSSTVAETRLPNNDVTLFDQSYVAAALFKSAAAGCLLFDYCPDEKIKSTTEWRLLTVGMGTDHYESRAIKVGDWLGARSELNKFFERVRRYVEVDLAVGSLLYRDESVCVFSFPGEYGEKDKVDQKGKNDVVKCLTEVFYREFDRYAKDYSLETPPYCEISPRSRSLVLLTKEIRKAKETLAVPFHREWSLDSDVKCESNGSICPVCQIRRNGSKKAGDPCPVCQKRRKGRLAEFLDPNSDLRKKELNDTIWFSEVADSNDRLAMLTLGFDLEPWLDGSRLESFRAQAIPQLAVVNLKKSDFYYKELYRHVGGILDKKISTDICPVDEIMEFLSSGYGDPEKNSRGKIKKNNQGSKINTQQIGDFYDKIVSDRSDAPKWGEISDEERAAWLAHMLLQKLPSPGRVYRFQRQTKSFFEELFKEFKHISAASENRWRVRRVILTPKDPHDLKLNEIYSCSLDGVPMDLLYQKEGFLTISNLSRIIPAMYEKNFMKKPLDLKFDDGESQKSVSTVIQSVNDAGTLGVYHPIISLELSPIRFRVLVPLEAASRCVNEAILAWERRFSKVWDRLPLKIGLVAFSRTTPFQAVVDGTRIMEDALKKSSSEVGWRVSEVSHRDGVTSIGFVDPSHGERERFLRSVPVTFSDGRRDLFYPYVKVEDKEARFPLDFCVPRNKGHVVYRHVDDLRPGDGVSVAPSVFASVFLDSVGRRYDDLDCHPIDEWRRMEDLWSLIENNVDGQSALKGIWVEMTDKKASWKDEAENLKGERLGVWLDLVRSLFRRIGMEGAALDCVVRAAETGLLERCLDWNMTVLKRSVNGGASL